jgi:hypothetical protein
LHRGDDPGRLEARQIARVGDLQMLDPPAPRLSQTAGELLEHADHIVIGLVADRVDRELAAAVGDFTGLAEQFGGRGQAQPARVGLVVIGRLEPRPA